MSKNKRYARRKSRPPKPRSRKARPSKKKAPRLTLAVPEPGVPRSRAPSAPEVMADPGYKRWTRLLTKVDRDPDSALEDPRCLKPHFLALFFDLCDGKILEAPWAAADYIEVALELAERSGDQHQMNVAAGIVVHGLIAGKQWQQAQAALEMYRPAASGCCRVCVSDWLRRCGDLLAEAQAGSLARKFLKLSARVLGEKIDDDTRGRILFVRGIAHFSQGKRARALDDAGRALMLVSLASPRGYFLDAVAFLACFLEASQSQRLDRQALEVLARFSNRLKGLKGWNEVHDRVRWVEGQLHARLGHSRGARRRLERARKAHVAGAPHRWALAIGIDQALTYCRCKDPETYLDLILRVMKECRERLNLEPELGQRVGQFLEQVAKSPWRVGELLEEFRRSFVVPVPGLLVELRREVVRNRQWCYDGENTPH